MPFSLVIYHPPDVLEKCISSTSTVLITPTSIIGMNFPAPARAIAELPSLVPTSSVGSQTPSQMCSAVLPSTHPYVDGPHYTMSSTVTVMRTSSLLPQFSSSASSPSPLIIFRAPAAAISAQRGPCSLPCSTFHAQRQHACETDRWTGGQADRQTDKAFPSPNWQTCVRA